MCRLEEEYSEEKVLELKEKNVSREEEKMRSEMLT